MTLLLIVLTLLATPRRHAEWCVLVAVAEEALTKWKGQVEAALGYDTAQVDQWIIINGRHASRSRDKVVNNGHPHLAQCGGNDLAGYKSYWLLLPFSLGWAATYAPGPYTGSCVLGYHCFSQECPHHTQTLADEVYSVNIIYIELGKGNYQVYYGMAYVCTVNGALTWQSWIIYRTGQGKL
ncbi:hypothetical protein BDN71DRAFT_1431621 [Pleurotus eryngii]|uniref:Uncharacterized protein n=1 Tax=Pleurotus eryngii TaxID=5323 RepID=A0A9P5ZV43_PLEER|nr:hypothetical protein BDN71DRAFT_1431621 [Pleurotus eryngii]